MENEEKGQTACCCPDEKHWKHRHWHGKGGGGAFYFVGFIGAAIYFIGHAATFSMGVLGFLKALVWPAFLVYELFKFLLG